MLKGVLVAAIMTVGTTVIAQTAPSNGYPAPPPVAGDSTPVPEISNPRPAAVWNGIGFGMSRDAAMAALPGSRNDGRNVQLDDTPIVGKCRAKASIEIGDAGVDKIILKGAGSVGGRCSETVFDAMASKYGPPLAETGNRGSILARRGAIYIWNRPGGVTMRFKRYNDNGIGGGGLLQSSWELTYSTVGGDIAL